MYSINMIERINVNCNFTLSSFRESSFNMTRGGGGNEDIETRSLKF